LALLLLAALFPGTGCQKNAAVAPPLAFAGTGASPAVASAGTGAAAVSGTAAPPALTAGTSAPTMTGAVSQAGASAAQAGAASTAVAGSGAPVVRAGTGGDVPAPTPGASEWTMIGFDAASTYNNTRETVLTKQNAGSLSMAWQVDMGTNVYGAPLQVGDKIYASAGTGIRALDAASGKELWRAIGGTSGSMAYDSGTLYYYTTAGNIVAINAADGQQKWSKAPKDSPGGDGSSSPVIAGNLLLIGGSNGGAEVLGARFRGFLAAFDKTSGNGVWTSFTVPATATGASLWSSAAADVAGGRAFGSTGNNHGAPATDSSDSIIGFNLMSGDILWKNQRTMGDMWGPSNDSPDADFGANPVLYEAMVDGVVTKLVSSAQKSGDAHSIQRDDGKLVWTRKLCEGPGTRDGKLGVFVNGAWSGKYMLFACNGNEKSTLFALNGATGEIGWMTPLPGEVFGRMSVANGVGFVGSGSNLVVFDTDTGMILKMVASMGGTVAGTVTIANGRVAFGEGLTWASGVAGRTLTVLKVQ
jgi:polyvinyl alcohol dehydrogenase (cytochrome)